MSDISEKDVTVVTGEVIEKSARLLQTDTNQNNIGTMYPFVLIKTDQGEIIRINNLVADAHTDQQISVGLETTLYLRQIRHITNFKKMNLAIAARSENGIGIIELPLRIIFGLFYMSLFIGIILGPIFGFIAAIPLYAVFGGFGIFLAILLGISIPAYLLWTSMKFANARSTSIRLGKKLIGRDGSGDKYRGVAVRNI